MTTERLALAHPLPLPLCTLCRSDADVRPALFRLHADEPAPPRAEDGPESGNLLLCSECRGEVWRALNQVFDERMKHRQNR